MIVLVTAKPDATLAELRDAVPTLRPGDVVVLDNLAVHKQPEIRTAIDATGAHLRFLTPYSPDLNPIEQALPN